MSGEAFRRWLWGFWGWLALILTQAGVEGWWITLVIGAGLATSILIVAER